MDKVLVADITAGRRARVEELRVRPLGSTGFGNYSCVANNSVGMKSAILRQVAVFKEMCNAVWSYIHSSIVYFKHLATTSKMLTTTKGSFQHDSLFPIYLSNGYSWRINTKQIVIYAFM